jgi:hypothetical protein
MMSHIHLKHNLFYFLNLYDKNSVQIIYKRIKILFDIFGFCIFKRPISTHKTIKI